MMSIIAELKRFNALNTIKTSKNMLKNATPFLGWILDFSLITACASLLLIFEALPMFSWHEITLIALGFMGAMLLTDVACERLFLVGYKHTIIKTVLACTMLYILTLPDQVYLLILSSVVSYYFIVKPTWNFFRNVKLLAQKKYDKTDTVLVIEDTRGPILDDIIQNISERYNIKIVVSLTGKKTFLRKSHVYSLKKLESTLLSLRYFLFGNTIKQLIYVADTLNKKRITDLIYLCAKYNFRLFKTPYLSNITKFVQDRINIMPISLNDISGTYSISDNNRQFLLQYCKDKNIWINYAGESLIQGLILAIAKTGVKFINIFVSCEKHAQEVDVLLQDFPSLPYSIRLSMLTSAIKFSIFDKIDVAFYTTPINNPCLEFDNTCSIFEKNTLNTIELIDTCMAKQVLLFILSDVEATLYKNWPGVTQRLAEIYAKTQENKSFCNIIRVPFSTQTDNKLLKEFVYSLNTRDSINLRHKADFLSQETHILDSLISAIIYSLEDTDKIFIIKDILSCNAKDVYKLFLNFYGLRLYEDMRVPYSSLDPLNTDAFETPNVRLVKTPIKNLYSEEIFIQANKNSIKTLLEPSKDFIRQNNMSEITQLGISVLKQIYNQYNESGILNRRLV